METESTKMSRFRATISEQAREIATGKTKLADVLSRLCEREKTIAELKSKLNGTLDTVDGLTRQLRLLEKTVESKDKELTDFTRSVTSEKSARDKVVVTQLADRDRAITRLQKNYTTLLAENDGLKQKLDKLQKKVDSSDPFSDMNADLMMKLQVAETSNRKSQDTITELREENDQLRASIEEYADLVKTKITGLEKRVSGLRPKTDVQSVVASMMSAVVQFISDDTEGPTIEDIPRPPNPSPHEPIEPQQATPPLMITYDCIPGPIVTDAPVTDAPVTDAPVTDAPVTDAPVTDAPVTDAPGDVVIVDNNDPTAVAATDGTIVTDAKVDEDLDLCDQPTPATGTVEIITPEQPPITVTEESTGPTGPNVVTPAEATGPAPSGWFSWW